ncbi:MAG: adenylosuccinate lyase [Anaerolineales bacterium]
MSDDLLALSPLDGRYLRETESLREHFSEFAYIQDRVRIEITYLIALSHETRLVRVLTSAELDFLNTLSNPFSLDDARQIKDLERITRHDVKAIENFLRLKLAPTSLSDLVEFLHFGLTSEDVNNIAQAFALRDSRDQVILPALDKILNQLGDLIRKYKSTPMLARTHGQPAVPTTFGKEIATFYARLKKQYTELASHRFEAKFNGAAGNFNALISAAPQVDWSAFSEKFIHELGLKPNLITAQILPYDNWIEYFDTLHLVNSILIDFAQDIWRYISDDYLKLKVIASEVGSSTMPQKVNPIDFENAEGNLGVANALLEQYARKLPISRLQRDLSDSTVRRTFGVALGHSLVAYASLGKALERVEANESTMRAELEAHWEVVAEGAQTILRAAGVSEAYDQLKSIARGKEITKESFVKWVENLSVDESMKGKLRGLSPLTYIGLAEEIAERTLKEKNSYQEET